MASASASVIIPRAAAPAPPQSFASLPSAIPEESTSGSSAGRLPRLWHRISILPV